MTQSLYTIYRENLTFLHKTCTVCSRRPYNMISDDTGLVHFVSVCARRYIRLKSVVQTPIAQVSFETYSYDITGPAPGV